MANRKGERRGRELVTLLDDLVFAVMRAPASGSAINRELPDVLAGNGERFSAIEAKSSNGNPIYLTAEEVEGLTYFADSYGATPRIGIRFDEEDPKGLWTVPLESMLPTLPTDQGGNDIDCFHHFVP